MEDPSPTLLQTLVQTLFCPNNERDQEVDDSPMANIPGDPGPGPQLVDLFTPEFCLRIGDTFVKSFRTEVPHEINRWLNKRSNSLDQDDNNSQ